MEPSECHRQADGDAQERRHLPGLPDEPRHRIHLVSLPAVDVDENAAIVNALQSPDHGVRANAARSLGSASASS